MEGVHSQRPKIENQALLSEGVQVFVPCLLLHLHSTQKRLFVYTPQQSPPSKLKVSKLYMSSQNPSLTHFKSPVPSKIQKLFKVFSLILYPYKVKMKVFNYTNRNQKLTLHKWNSRTVGDDCIMRCICNF